LSNIIIILTEHTKLQ